MDKTGMTATATMMLERQSRSLIAHAMHRLLHRLLPHMRAVPVSDDEEMPEHLMAWMTKFDGGPEKTIGEAIEATPALWMQFLPPEVCIVPRKTLERISGLDQATIDYLAMEGAYIITSRSAHKLHELEDAERECRLR